MAHKINNQAARILVVDDDDILRYTLEELLQAQGYAVETAANGMAALQKLQMDRFDMVVTDLYMPGMTGLELIDHITETKIDIIPILMSSLFSQEIKKNAGEKGAFASLDKPFPTNRLLDIIETSMLRKQRTEYKATGHSAH